MQYREIIAVCSEIHTEHTSTLCGQNVAFYNVKHGGTYSDHWANTTLYYKQIVPLRKRQILYCSVPVQQNFYELPAEEMIRFNFPAHFPQRCKVNHTPTLIGFGQSNFLLSRQ
jgi:hypothetical protein